MKIIKYGVIAIAVLIGLPIGCSMITTATTVATTPSRVINKTLETNNVIANYETFFNRKAEFDGRVAQIETHQAVISATNDPAELSRLRMELAAQRQSCRELANNYNADAQKLNRGLFRDNNLPANLEVTACEKP